MQLARLYSDFCLMPLVSTRHFAIVRGRQHYAPSPRQVETRVKLIPCAEKMELWWGVTLELASHFRIWSLTRAD